VLAESTFHWLTTVVGVPATRKAQLMPIKALAKPDFSAGRFASRVNRQVGFKIHIQNPARREDVRPALLA
jgi:hypothetical protein